MQFGLCLWVAHFHVHEAEEHLVQKVRGISKLCLIFRYENDIDSFKDAAKACVQAWKERTYEAPTTSDPHYPAFSHYQPHIHEPVRATMLAEARKHEVRNISF